MRDVGIVDAAQVILGRADRRNGEARLASEGLEICVGIKPNVVASVAEGLSQRYKRQGIPMRSDRADKYPHRQ